jgi:hypothetical protein
MTNEMIVQDDAQLMESVLLGGDLSKLNPAQRVSYYQRVCSSLGLNPLTKPFDYINLNGKLTLYARKDAADQLRKINSVSIDDVDITETEKQYIVKVKGHDKEGRADVEVGVVNKTDMRGDLANAQMKAVTKAKRRLTLSLCGLGMLDETEVQTIPNARPVVVAETGEIVDAPAIAAETISQETGAPSDVIEMVDPMGDWAVPFAAEKWGMDNSHAAQEIARKKLGKRILKTEFIQIVTGAPAA